MQDVISIVKKPAIIHSRTKAAIYVYMKPVALSMHLVAADRRDLGPWSQLPQIYADLQHPFDTYAAPKFTSAR